MTLQVGDRVQIIDQDIFSPRLQVGDEGVVCVLPRGGSSYYEGDFTDEFGSVHYQCFRENVVSLVTPRQKVVKKTGFSKFMQKIETS
jgi:hypothetical protein